MKLSIRILSRLWRDGSFLGKISRKGKMTEEEGVKSWRDDVNYFGVMLLCTWGIVDEMVSGNYSFNWKRKLFVQPYKLSKLVQM